MILVLREMTMQETRNENMRETGTEDTKTDDVPSESESPSPTLRPLEVLQEPSLVSAGLHEKSSSSEELQRNIVRDGLLCYRASNILWSTGSFSEPIPNGFYSVILVSCL